MYQSSTRNNFLDILLDPTAIAILGSIALHAIIAASFPFLFQPDKPGKKADTGSVKVVELTPNELQRIPQAPPPIIPQTLPPVYQPSVPVAPAAPPRAPKISTAPQTIPSSPIRTAPKATAKPVPVTKAQTAKPKAQPSPLVFGSENSFDPKPLPSKVSAKPDPTKPAPPSQTPAKPAKPTKPTSPKPTEVPQGYDTGPELQPTPAPGSGRQSQKPPATPQPAGSPNAIPGSTPSATPPSNDVGGGNGFYGNYTQLAIEQLKIYQAKYPGLIVANKKLVVKPYPPGIPCSKVKQSPFIVFMPVFGKTPENSDPTLGSSTADVEDGKIFAENTKENEVAILQAKKIAVEEAQEENKNRTEVQKKSPIVYSLRIQFDPTTCKN
jgi:hypothetical protein